MKFFINGRQTGKTTRAIFAAFEQAKEYPVAFITFNKEERDRLRAIYRSELSGSKLEIFSLDELNLMTGLRKFRGIYVDNIDIVLMRMFHRFIEMEHGGRVELVTATGEPVRDLEVIRNGAIRLWQEACLIVMNMVESTKDKGAVPLLAIIKFREKIRQLEGVKHGQPVQAQREDSSTSGSKGASSEASPASSD